MLAMGILSVLMMIKEGKNWLNTMQLPQTPAFLQNPILIPGMAVLTKGAVGF